MMEKRIKNLVKTWYEKAKFEQDPFPKFIFLWICFNAWLDYKSDKFLDSEMIRWLIEQTPSTSDLVLSYENAKKTEPFMENLKTLANMSPIYDSRGRRNPIKIKDESDFENMVKAIYRVRCNLFHGGKEANDSRDKKLVEVSKRILEKWIGNLITSWRCK